MKLLICDRLEGDKAVLLDENETAYVLPLSLFENGAEEGGVYRLDLVRDETETQNRSMRIRRFFDQLKEKGNQSK